MHVKTPLIEKLNVADFSKREIMFKMECYQPSSSFKLRGIGLMCQEAVEAGATHLISSSGGNAGLSAAYAGRKLGTKVTVVIPKTTPDFIIKKLELENAKVIVHGDVWDEAHEYALSIAKDKNVKYIPPFDHPKLWEGHSTIIDEIKEQYTQPDAIILSVGGGGLLCGVIEGLIKNNWEDTQVIAVETEGTASLFKSIRKNKLITLDKIDSIAKSLGAKKVSLKAFEYAKKYNVKPYLVSDEAAINACVKFANDYRVLVEPACGVSLSLIYDNAEIIKSAKRVLVVVCGGAIINLDKLIEWKSRLDIN